MDKKYANKRRSFSAVVVEKYLRLSGWKRRYTEKGYEKFMAALDTENYKPPKIAFKSTVKKYGYPGGDVYTVTKSANPKKTVIYLHGGAYVTQPKYFHWKAVDKLVQLTDAEFIVPLYPLAPRGNCEEAYAFLEKLYKDVVSGTSGEVILMGDSAGGGMIFGFCESIYGTDLPQPYKIIAVSPWLDVTMTNERISGYLRSDPMLAVYGSVKMGVLWAGGLDTKDYRVSPLYGNVEALNDVYIFAGTREILYPDAVEFYEKLQKSGARGTFLIGRGMNHDFPFYPIPEGRRALKEISRIILDLT